MADANRWTTVVAWLCAVVAATQSATMYDLGSGNVVHVTETQRTCGNGRSASVPSVFQGTLAKAFPGANQRFTSTVDGRMALMDREPEDERGHVLASQFGGPAAEWNLIPQWWSVNRKIRNEAAVLDRWIEWERWARYRLDHGAGPITFSIRIEYPGNKGCRPSSFRIEAQSRAISKQKYPYDFKDYAAQFRNDINSLSVTQRP